MDKEEVKIFKAGETKAYDEIMAMCADKMQQFKEDMKE